MNLTRRGFLGALAAIVAVPQMLKLAPSCWRCGTVGGPGRYPVGYGHRWWKCMPCIERDIERELRVELSEHTSGRYSYVSPTALERLRLRQAHWEKLHS